MIAYPAISPLPGDRHAPEQAIGMAGLGDRHRPDSLIDFTGIRTHEYFGVSLEIVWDILQNKLPDLRATVSKILVQIK
jgi:hypothetical protein